MYVTLAVPPDITICIQVPGHLSPEIDNLSKLTAKFQYLGTLRSHGSD
jgi:hypothetical protein